MKGRFGMPRKPSRFVGPLTGEEKEILRYLVDHGETPRIRRRAHAVLLSDAGKTVNELMEVFETTRTTVCSWLESWEAEGPGGLADAPRSGAPPKLEDSERKVILELLKEHPHSPKQVLRRIPKVIGKTISESTLRRIARRSGLRWKRMRKSLKSRRDDDEFEAACDDLCELMECHKSRQLDLYYFDEAGFSLNPTVPYAWQPIGETTEIPSRRSRQVNALGFLRLDSKLRAYSVEGSIDSEVVIACFNDFCKSRRRRRPAFVVMDNASAHTSSEFERHIPLWEEKGLFLYFLPPYCPELNLIEILWRMIKYHWLPLKAYESLACLVRQLHEVFAKVGTDYVINFASASSS